MSVLMAITVRRQLPLPTPNRQSNATMRVSPRFAVYYIPHGCYRIELRASERNAAREGVAKIMESARLCQRTKFMRSHPTSPQPNEKHQ